MDCSNARLLCPWNFPGKNIGAGFHFRLQAIFPPRDWTWVSCIFCIGRWVLYQLGHQWSPIKHIIADKQVNDVATSNILKLNIVFLKEININIHWKDWCWSWSPILRPPDAKSRLIRKGPDAGKDWEQEEKGVKEDKMVGWHHQSNGHEFEKTPGNSEGPGSLVCFSLEVTKSQARLSNWAITLY